jgi:LacI family transcriptional regulator
METRQRVQAAIEMLGYQPNAVARSLVKQRTNVLGLVTIDFEDYFFAGVCHGVQEEARRRGYLLMITNTDRCQELESEYIQRLHSQRVDGIIVVRDTLIQTNLALLVDLNGLPVVVTSFRFKDEPAILVDMDNEDGGRQVAEHFINSGHREFAIISAPPQYQVSHDRNKGFLSALSRNGLPHEPAFMAYGDWHYEGGYQAAQTLLPYYPAFTAIFVHNDDMAIGAIRAIHEAGLRVPEDISVIGYDDVPVAAHLEIPLTTVWQPRHEMGAMIVRLMMKMINDEIINPHDKIVLQPHLVSRATVKIRSS